MKKVLALALAAVMVMALCGVAFASNNTSNITVNETATIYEYEVYQIYTGDLDDHTLSNVVYGANYGTPGTAVPAAELEALEAIASNSDAMKAQARAFYSAKSGTPVARISYDATNGYKATGLANGYYLIVEKYAAGVDIPAGSELSINIVTIQETDLVINPKRDTTTIDKKISGDTLGSGDTHTFDLLETKDNVSIGDTVHFQISSQVSANAAEYDRYFFIIEDTLSDGLTYTTDSLKVYTTAVNGANLLVENTDYDLSVVGQNIKVGLRDAKSLANTLIIVTYDAVLNENAKIGEESNDNTVKLKYSNDPHHSYDGDKDNDNPGFPASDKNPPLGETPQVKTETYTTGIQIQKVDEKGNVLTGAGFTLTGDSTEIVLVSSETFAEVATGGTHYKLNDGTYTTKDPQMNDQMVETPGASAGYVVAEDGYSGTDAKTVGGTVYRHYKPADDSGKTVYKLIEKNDDLYESTEKKYAKTVTYTEKNTTASTPVKATAMVGADGIVIFKGLGAGEYTITETTTPAGYNTISPITFTIAFDKTATPKWSTTSSDARYNATTGLFEIEIENRGGTELPTTGGIGTTIFYVSGLIMVLGAAVILVARRRADAE